MAISGGTVSGATIPFQRENRFQQCLGPGCSRKYSASKSIAMETMSMLPILDDRHELAAAGLCV